MSDDTVTMQRFTGKARRLVDGQPTASIYFQDDGGVSLKFSREAKEQWLDGVQYVDFYTSEAGTHVGVKPVSDGDVDDRSYKLSFDSVSFGAMATELGLEGDDAIRAECEWDDDAGMIVFDLSDVIDA